ncbi:unnamed protein product, partial [Amoebophrya sp. A25]
GSSAVPEAGKAGSLNPRAATFVPGSGATAFEVVGESGLPQMPIQQGPQVPLMIPVPPVSVPG